MYSTDYTLTEALKRVDCTQLSAKIGDDELCWEKGATCFEEQTYDQFKMTGETVASVITWMIDDYDILPILNNNIILQPVLSNIETTT